MIRLFSAIALFLISTTVNIFAGERIKIEKSAIAAAVSRTEHNNLIQRFKSGDTTLTTAQIAEVYYGETLRPGYNRNNNYEEIFKAYDDADYAKALSMARNALDKDPCNLAVLFKAYASASTDKTKQAEALTYLTRINQICDLIFTSGTGVSPSSPYIVATASDQNEFLIKYLQPTAIGSSSQVGALNAIKVTFPDINNEVILYFKQF